MKLGIINSAFSQVGVDTATGLKHIARIGFDCVDIFTEAMTISAEEKRLIASTCEKQGLPIMSLPVVATGLIDFNEPVRDFHVTRCKRYIDLAAEFGARNVLVVLGEYLWQREVIAAADQWGWAIETCRKLGDYADGRNLDIALELEPFRMSLLNSVGEMARFIDECAHPRVRANIDISHCDGKVHGDLPPGRGIVKFSPYLQAIKELSIPGVISIELEYSPDPARIVEWVEEAYRETDRLMNLAGLRG